MKNLAKLLVFGILISFSCGKSKNQEHHDENSASNPNQALYDQVMDLHNEVMPKTNVIYQLKKELQEKIAGTSDMSADKKKQLEQIIHELDSADHSMMDWMHHFNPLPDSANQESSREYLEDQMEKIKNVKELINSTIEKAKVEVEKK